MYEEIKGGCTWVWVKDRGAVGPLGQGGLAVGPFASLSEGPLEDSLRDAFCCGGHFFYKKIKIYTLIITQSHKNLTPSPNKFYVINPFFSTISLEF